jgi:hypothetical protein
MTRARTAPTRDGMGPLVGVGGLHVPGDRVRDLERELDVLCTDAGFPASEEFKWSPKRTSWEYQQLKFEARDDFNLAALSAAREAGATGIVVMADTTKGKADSSAESPEEDVARMFLERAQNHLGGRGHAIVVWDRPGGGRRAETDFLAGSLAALRAGTNYTKLDGLALTVRWTRSSRGSSSSPTS